MDDTIERAWTGKWLAMALIKTSPTGKTHVWSVTSLRGDELGMISWFGRWRCYAFNPYSATIFNAGCLRDIASFCERQTLRHRSRLKLVPDHLVTDGSLDVR
jgi:hypothetical protein